MKLYEIYMESDEIIKVFADTHWFSEDTRMLILGISDGSDYADASFVMPIFNLKYFYIKTTQQDSKATLH